MAYKPEEPCPEFDYKNWQATYEMVRTPHNRKMTKSLFKETIGTPQLKKYVPSYTLREEPQWEAYHGVWLPSAKKIYLNSVNEYEAAHKLVCSMEHWNKLLELAWFVEGTEDFSWTSLTQWREEHKQIRETETLSLLRDQANKGNVAAMKALLQYETKDKRGRPSKAEVAGERKKQAKTKTEVDHDHERVLKLVKNNGQ